MSLRYLRLLPAVLVLATLAAPAGGLAQTGDPPRLVLDSADHDFGPIPRGARVNHRYQVSNGGGSPLSIYQVSPACGCTSTLLGKATLLPGETTAIEVTFDAAGMAGRVHKNILVRSNDPERQDVTLTFQATLPEPGPPPAVLPPAVRIDAERVEFLRLGPGDRRKLSVRIASLNGQPVLVDDVELSEAPWLGVATRPVGKDIYVDLDMLARNLPAGRRSGIDHITLHVSNPRSALLYLSVRWEKR